MKNRLFHSIVVLFVFVTSCNQAPEMIPETFQNPILPGFHPDPSICRVGDDYYIVNSSFEWFPGVPVHHSKDLVNWELIGYALSRPEQLQMLEGMRPSRGIWAPTIRYHDGLFYMITTCQDCGGNFFVTATDPSGPWSNPVFIERAPGIDPSLFWEDDGTVWYTGASRLGQPANWPNENSIWLQQIDLSTGKLLGEKTLLTSGHAANARWTEGPHLYKFDGKYLLMAAEGGTGFHHAITVFTSDSITGPYIPNHTNPVLTHRHLGLDHPITTTGHGDIVQTQHGDWWGVMLGVRPLERFNMLGRETFLTPVKIEEGAPVFNPGVGRVLEEDRRPDLPWTPVPESPPKDEFEGSQLRLEWNFLRTPLKQWYTLSGGKLLISSRPEKITDLVNPSLIARRIQHHRFLAATALEFNPDNRGEEAGLVVMQNNNYHYRLMMQWGEDGTTLTLIKREAGNDQVVATRALESNTIILAIEAHNLDYQFYSGNTVDALEPLGDPQDATICSTTKAGGFIGPYVGMYATSNGSASKNQAAFDWFEYREINSD